jgi:hypothetical protein
MGHWHTAVYRDGKLELLTPCDLPQGAQVSVMIEERGLEAALQADVERRREIRRAAVEHMMASPLSPDAPRLTREELHERR